MAKGKSVWGIDIGQCALKAIRVTEVDGEIQVQDFETIEHPQILSQPDADRRELIRQALEQFIATHNVRGTSLCIGVPGQVSFTKFVKLPPVEVKKIPDIVRFEAEQQIPFPIDEVIWQWQTFQDPDSPDIEVGIFAMKRGDIYSMLDHFTDLNLSVDHVQMSPLALYNFMVHDNQLSGEGATLLADVGADKTDLVVSDNQKLWTRTIQIGGNNFTEALVKAFKLSFAKAEKLKRTAVTSKYAKQIFQAMRPVFADLVQEIQRSIGFYTTTHRETRFKKLIGLGNGFRLPGLERFLEQNLNIQVVRVDSYNNISVAEGVNAPAFNENVLSFAVAYGLALQGLDRAAVRTNMLPTEIARRRQWKSKQPWFAAAAAVVLAALAGPIYRSYRDLGVLENTSLLTEARADIQAVAKNVSEYGEYSSQGEKERNEIEQSKKLFAYRTFWPRLQDVILRSLEEVAPDQGSLVQYAFCLEKRSEYKYRIKELEAKKNDAKAAQEVVQLKAEVEKYQAAISEYEKSQRSKRRQVFVEAMDATYYPDLTQARNDIAVGRMERKPGGEYVLPTIRSPMEGAMGRALAPRTDLKRGFLVRLLGRTTVSVQEAMAGVLSPLQKRTDDLCKLSTEFGLLDYPKVDILSFGAGTGPGPGPGGLTPGVNPIPMPPPMMEGAGYEGLAPPMVGGGRPGGTAGATDSTQKGPAMPDRLLPKEDMTPDTRFIMHWIVEIRGDGLSAPAPVAAENKQ